MHVCALGAVQSFGDRWLEEGVVGSGNESALISASRGGMRDKTNLTGRMAWPDWPAII